MGFPTIKAKAGSLVIIYTTDAGGVYPIHGAYLSRSSDANVWIPCAWTIEGYHLSKSRPTDLDICGEVGKLNKKKLENAKVDTQAQEEAQTEGSIS